MFNFKSLASVAIVLAGSFGQSFANDPWFFTAKEIANAYRYQQQFGARLHNPLEPQACLHGRMEFVASSQGRRFVAPCRFITETTRQLRELLESGVAKYLFPLDVDYADLAVPADLYESKYKHLSSGEMLPALLHEPALVAIYHTALHLAPEPGNKGSRTSVWGEKRTVSGFYDGRPNQLLARPMERGSYDQPEGLARVGSFAMLSHFLGELTFVAGETVVTFDLSFDNARAAAPPADIVTVRATAR
ncbi:MAG: hypothetical protein ACXWW4_11585 [Candidatus Binatia bacterium]